MDWKQELLKRLDVLAEKLGTTAAYLWSVLIRQAISDGVTDIVTAVFFAVVAYVVYNYGSRCLTKAKRSDRYDAKDYYIGGYLLHASTVILAGISTTWLCSAVQHFINPSYYALHEVLESLGK